MTQTLTEQAIEPAVAGRGRGCWRAYALTTRLLSAELQEAHGLTINDFEALLVLSYAEGGRLKRVELARNLLLTPSGITRLLGASKMRGSSSERPARATCVSPTRSSRTPAARSSRRRRAPIRLRSVPLLEEHFETGDLDAIAEILGKLPGVTDGDDSCSRADRRHPATLSGRSASLKGGAFLGQSA